MMQQKTDRLDDLAKLVIDRSNSIPNRRFILGIAGYPGAGKTTLAQALVSEINKNRDVAIVVPMDGFHLSNSKLEEMKILELKGIPDSFDAIGFITLLENLRKEPPTKTLCPLFDRSIEASIENAIEVKADHKIVITEGNYLLLERSPWNRVRTLVDEVWFVDTSFEVILPRLIERHIAAGRDPEGARLKVESTDMPNARLVDETRKLADRLVNADCGD